jgi:hypothetical protein
MSQVYPLPDGQRVRLRIVQRRDEQQIRAIFAQVGSEPEDFEVMRLLRSDPRRRAVICATALVGTTETVVGLGAIELGGRADAEPDVLIADMRVGEGLDELLRGALRGHASAITRARTAA